MTTITLRLPRPHAAQRDILNSPIRYKVIACGRRFGKTELFCNTLLNGHSSSSQGALQGYPVAYVSLTYKNVKELWGRLVDTIPPELLRYKNEGTQYLELITGGSIECWTFERFISARGRAYAGICLDEAAQTRNLKEAWQEVFIAMLMDFSGWALIGSTPQGFNYFYELFRYGQDPNRPNWESWQFSSYDNPYMPTSEIEQIKALLPEIVFRREYLANFEVSEGLVFDNFSLTGNVRESAEYNPELEVYWGVDDGYAHGGGVGTFGHHPRVFLLGQQTSTGGVNIFAEYYQTLQMPESSLKEVMSWPYKLPRIALVDSSAAELRRRLSDNGIFNGAATHRISDGIKIMRRFVCDGNSVRLLQIHPRCKNLIRELQSYRYDDKSRWSEAGEPKPMKLDDHTIDACRYLLWNFK